MTKNLDKISNLTPQMKNWETGDVIFIKTPNSTDNNNVISHIISQYEHLYREDNAMLLTPRAFHQKTYKALFKKRARRRFVATYTKINGSLGINPEESKSYIDEKNPYLLFIGDCQELVTDSPFLFNGDKLVKHIVKHRYNKLVIFMSHFNCPELCDFIENKCDVTVKRYIMKDNFDMINKLEFITQNQENKTLNVTDFDVENCILKEALVSDNKTLIMAEGLYGKLRHAKGNPNIKILEGENAQTTKLEEILTEEKELIPKILIANPVVDCGLYIKDKNLKDIIVFTDKSDISFVLKAINRKVSIDKRDKVNVKIILTSDDIHKEKFLDKLSNRVNNLKEVSNNPNFQSELPLKANEIAVKNLNDISDRKEYYEQLLNVDCKEIEYTEEDNETLNKKYEISLNAKLHEENIEKLEEVLCNLKGKLFKDEKNLLDEIIPHIKKLAETAKDIDIINKVLSSLVFSSRNKYELLKTESGFIVVELNL